MADFLTRLAERAVGTAALARPLVRPLFSQAPSGEVTSPGGKRETASFPPPEQREPRAGAEPERHGRASTVSVLKEAMTETVRRDPAPRRGGKGPMPAAEDIASRVGMTRWNVDETGKRTHTPPPERSAIEIAGLQATTDASTDSIGVVAPPLRKDGAHTTLVQDEIEPHREASRAIPAWERPRQEADLPVGPGLQSRHTGAERFDRSPSRTPVVKVSIGRIEVRAVTPPEPRLERRPSQPPGPSLTLDDYLKRRRRGER